MRFFKRFLLQSLQRLYTIFSLFHFLFIHFLNFYSFFLPHCLFCVFILHTTSILFDILLIPTILSSNPMTGSVDLITAAMVFHHVTHVTSGTYIRSVPYLRIHLLNHLLIYYWIYSLILSKNSD